MVIPKRIVYGFLIFVYVLGVAVLLYQWQQGSVRKIVTPPGQPGGRGIGLHEQVAGELSASLLIYEFDPATSTAKGNITIKASVKYLLEKGFVKVRYNNIAASVKDLGQIRSLTSLYLYPQAVSIGSLPPEIDVTSYSRTITVVSAEPVEIRLVQNGLYPYNTNDISLAVFANGLYWDKDGKLHTGGIIDAPLEILTQTTPYLTYISSGTTKYDALTQTIVFRQPYIPQILFPVLYILLFIFIVSILAIRDLSNMLEISIALALGVWGLREALLPTNIPAPARLGIEQTVLMTYAFYGVTILGWYVLRWLDRVDARRQVENERPLPQADDIDLQSPMPIPIENQPEPTEHGIRELLQMIWTTLIAVLGLLIVGWLWPRRNS